MHDTRGLVEHAGLGAMHSSTSTVHCLALFVVHPYLSNITCLILFIAIEGIVFCSDQKVPGISHLNKLYKRINI